MRNRHPGTCYLCHSLVRAGEGHVTRRPNGSGWQVEHGGCSAPVKDGPTILMYVEAGHFTASVLLRDAKVVEAAPILQYMTRWSRERVETYCRKKGWLCREIPQ